MTSVVASRFRNLAEGLAAADAATRQDGLPAALDILKGLRHEFPVNREPIRHACALLQSANRFDEAEEWLREARTQFPGDISFAMQYATAAQRRRDFEEGIRRWQSVRTAIPNDQAGYIGLVNILREAGRLDAAEEAATEALVRFPDSHGVLVAAAFVAHVRRDWPKAARRWEASRVADPGHHIGYVLGAQSLRECGEIDQAEALIAPAIERFPDFPIMSVEFAWMAHAKRDWTAALDRWAMVRARFPDEVHSYTAAAHALRELQCPDEADSMLGSAVARFPHLPNLVVEHAWAAHVRRDWSEAIRRWAALRERYPEEPRGWQSGVAALREAGQLGDAEALCVEALTRFPNHEPTLAEYATIAQSRSDWAAAVQRWEALRQAAPGNLSAFSSGAHALRQAGLHKEAEALLEQAAQRFPDAASPLIDHAWIASHRQEWPEAINRWKRVLARLPDDPIGYFGMAIALRSSRHLDEADVLLQQAMAKFPDNSGLACEYAWVAGARADWVEAHARWQHVRTRFPENANGHVGLARVVRDRGDLEAAEHIIETALKAQPDEVVLLLEHAMIANHRQNWNAAVERFAMLRARYPNVHQSYTAASLALRELRRCDEAEALTRDAINRFPNEPEPLQEYAAVATARGDWDDALQQLKDANKRFPGNGSLQKALHEAQLRAGIEEDDPAEAKHVTGSAEAASEREQIRQIVSAFTSLGGEPRGCEFGEMQRFYGAEPLDLLRWTHSPPEGLIAALETRFAGVGTPEQTEVYSVLIDGRELQYDARDKRFGLGTHTYIRMDDASQEKVLAQTCRRQQYLRNKLITDLQEANKIFAYRSTLRDMADDELDRLYAAIRSYNSDTTLLYSRYSDSEHPNGTVEVARPGLLFAYFDSFGATRTGEQLGVPTATWATVCREAYRLWQSGATRAPAGAPATEAVTTSVEPIDPMPGEPVLQPMQDAPSAIAAGLPDEIATGAPTEITIHPSPDITIDPPPDTASDGGWRRTVWSLLRRGA